MKNVILAAVASFSIGFVMSARAESIKPEPQEMPSSCKAAGQSCDDKEDCCSRMCRKDTKKCA